MPNRSRALEAAMYDAIAQLGRNGDTELAHVTPREKMLLEAMGGAGTINPRTGLREYYAGADIGSDFSEGGTSGAPGAASSDEGSAAGGRASEGEVSMNDLGTLGFDPADTSNRGRDPGTLGLDDGTSRGGMMSYAEDFGPPAPSFMDRARNQVDPRTQEGLFNLATAFAPVGIPARGMNAAVQALGEYVGGPLNEYFGGNAPAIGFDFSTGPEGRNVDLAAAMLNATPVSQPLMRAVEPGGVPEEIQSFIGPGMTDLQQRALISTYGTQGVNSAFRTDPVRRYYSRLLQRGLIQDGRPAQTPYTLPIEQLYMQNVLGRPVSNPGSTQDILAAIGGYL